MEVKLVPGSTGAVSSSSSGQDFLEPSGHPQAAVCDGTKVVFRNLVGGAGWGHGLDHLDELDLVGLWLFLKALVEGKLGAPSIVFGCPSFWAWLEAGSLILGKVLV